MTYKNFDEYFNEIEVYSMRSERFNADFIELRLNKYQRDRLIKWLKAAFEAGAESERLKTQGTDMGNTSEG